MSSQGAFFILDIVQSSGRQGNNSQKLECAYGTMSLTRLIMPSTVASIFVKYNGDNVKIVSALFVMLLLTFNANADDLDDGIGIDNPIDDGLDLDKNINFIKRSAIAKSKSKSGQSNSSQSGGCDGTGNIKIGAGSNLKGATIVNLSNNKGTSSVCTK